MNIKVTALTVTQKLYITVAQRDQLRNFTLIICKV